MRPVGYTKLIQEYNLAVIPNWHQSMISDGAVSRREWADGLVQENFRKDYEHTKESKSSFEIEHIKPTAARTERFVSLLQLAEREDFFHKDALIELQNHIVEERFRDRDYRANQNYVGESVSWQNERVHFVSPKPADLNELMIGMFSSHERMGDPSVHPVIHAAIIAYGFVFMHPFEDGNGRIHRFLIHNILSRRGFTPSGIMFPVSAAMLKQREVYHWRPFPRC